MKRRKLLEGKGRGIEKDRDSQKDTTGSDKRGRVNFDVFNLSG
jgi:hypothetical protein